MLESGVDKGIGKIATVLVQRGKLAKGDVLVCGTTSCKVKRVSIFYAF